MGEYIPVHGEELVRAVTAVINESFQTVAEELGITRENAAGFPAFIGSEKILGQIEHGLELYGYLEKGKLCGSVGLLTVGGGLVEIERLAVLPDYRHLGLGKDLVDFALRRAFAFGGKRAQVQLVNENERLRLWYGSLGFILDRVDYYKNLPFSVAVMSRPLP